MLGKITSSDAPQVIHPGPKLEDCDNPVSILSLHFPQSREIDPGTHCAMNRAREVAMNACSRRKPEHRLAALRCTLLGAVALGLAATGCHMMVEPHYLPSAVQASSAIRALQVGTFRGEAQFAATPTRIEGNGGDTYELPMAVSAFLHDAFLVEINTRQIVAARDAKRVDGQLVEFDFPWVEQMYNPSRARCFMSFRFTVRDRGQTLLEKTYEQSLELGVIKSSWGKPQGNHVAHAFAQLLRQVFDAFLQDPAVLALFSSSAPASSSAAPQTRAP